LGVNRGCPFLEKGVLGFEAVPGFEEERAFDGL
jgi:hypothetical protein